jgi:hypothetical protein
MGAKITSIEARAYRSLKFLDMKPTGTVIRLFGTNGAGKSNALAGLRAVLLGERDGAGDVVTHGEKRATFSVMLGDSLRVSMRWAASGSRTLEVLRVEDDGSEAVVKSPRELLDRIVGRFHDVGSILRVETPEAERNLRDGLLSAAGVSGDHIDATIAEAVADRAKANARAKQAKARLEGVPTPAAGTPADELSAAALVAMAEDVREKLDRRAEADRQQRELERAVEAARSQVAQIERQLSDARRHLADAEGKLDAHQLPEAPDQGELAAIRAQLSDLEETNGRIRQARAWRELQIELADADSAAKAAQAAIDEAQAEKASRLAGAQLPIPGAECTEDGLTYRGERFHNLSRAQRLVVAVGLGIATRGKLDVLLLDDAEGLDAENEALVEQMASDAGVQVIMASAVKESAGGIFVTGAEASIETVAVGEAARGAAA